MILSEKNKDFFPFLEGRTVQILPFLYGSKFVFNISCVPAFVISLIIAGRIFQILKDTYSNTFMLYCNTIFSGT